MQGQSLKWARGGRRPYLDMHPCGHQGAEDAREVQVLEGQGRAIVHKEDEPRELHLQRQGCHQARELRTSLGAQHGTTGHGLRCAHGPR